MARRGILQLHQIQVYLGFLIGIATSSDECKVHQVMMNYALHGIFSLTPKWCQENGCSKRSSVNDQKYCPCLGDWLRLSFYNDSPLKKTTTSPETSQLISRLLGTG